MSNRVTRSRTRRIGPAPARTVSWGTSTVAGPPALPALPGLGPQQVELPRQIAARHGAERARRPAALGCRRGAARRRARAPPLLHLVAAVHDQHAVGDLGHDAHVVGDEDDAHLHLGLEAADQFEDLRLDRDVEGRGRLIGDEQLRLAGQGHGDHHALAHAAGELVRVAREDVARLGDAHEVEHPQGLGPGG